MENEANPTEYWRGKFEICDEILRDIETMFDVLDRSELLISLCGDRDHATAGDMVRFISNYVTDGRRRIGAYEGPQGAYRRTSSEQPTCGHYEPDAPAARKHLAGAA